MSTSLADVRLALRGLRRSPLFSTVAILSLALGIGANTAIFTLIDQMLLRKLPVADPDQLVMLYQRGSHNGSNMGPRMHSYPIYQDLQQRAEPLAEVLCRRLVPASVSIDNQTERVEAEMVSGNFFSMLGVKPALGRVFNSRGGRPDLPGAPGRRAQLRLLGQPLRARSSGPRQEDPRQRLPDDDRRRVGEGIRRDRSGAVAADSRADPDEAGRWCPTGAGCTWTTAGPGGCRCSPGSSRATRVESAQAPLQGLFTQIRAYEDDASGREGLVAVLRASSS